MQRLAIQYVIFLTLAVFTGFILVLVLIAIAALNRGSSTVVSSPPQQAVTAIVTITPSEDLPTATTIPTPTASPFPDGVKPEWIPTPVQVEVLPTPLPGTSSARGRMLCNGVPKPLARVYLIVVQDDKPLIYATFFADEAGRWFLGDLPPETFIALGEFPKSMPTQTYKIKSDQINDFGDIELPKSLCE